MVIIDKRALKFGKHAWVHSEVVASFQDRPVQVIPVLVGGVSPSNIQVPEWSRRVGTRRAQRGPRSSPKPGVCLPKRSSTHSRRRSSGSKPARPRRNESAIRRRVPRDRTHARRREVEAQRSMEKRTAPPRGLAKCDESPSAAKNDPPGPFGVAMQVLQKLAETDLYRVWTPYFSSSSHSPGSTARSACADPRGSRGRTLRLSRCARSGRTMAYVTRSEAIWPPTPVHAVEPGRTPSTSTSNDELEDALKWVPPESPDISLRRPSVRAWLDRSRRSSSGFADPASASGSPHCPARR